VGAALGMMGFIQLLCHSSTIISVLQPLAIVYGISEVNHFFKRKQHHHHHHHHHQVGQQGLRWNLKKWTATVDYYLDQVRFHMRRLLVIPDNIVGGGEQAVMLDKERDSSLLQTGDVVSRQRSLTTELKGGIQELKDANSMDQGSDIHKVHMGAMVKKGILAGALLGWLAGI
jgi:hypothetical protein